MHSIPRHSPAFFATLATLALILTPLTGWALGAWSEGPEFTNPNQDPLIPLLIWIFPLVGVFAVLMAIDAFVVQKRLKPGWGRSLGLAATANAFSVLGFLVGILLGGMVDPELASLGGWIAILIGWCIFSIPLEFLAAQLLLASSKKYSGEQIFKTMLVANGVTAGVALIIIFICAMIGFI
ncbi:MAG: hypothetical protein D6E12_15885 [Desulfovibrio sp.]|nr:MAG: hypothetical protein D6E12_15885 [Desulfovibrio sp.]